MIQAILDIPVKQMESYRDLLKAVTKSLVEGGRKVERLKVQVYWQTGKLFDTYLTQHPEESQHGGGIAERLAEDLNMERTLFYRLLQFTRAFPNVAARRHLTWAHYRELLTVTNKETRKQLTHLAEANAWPSRKLVSEIKRQTSKRKKATSSNKRKLIEPARHTPGTYQVGWLQSHGAKREKVIDLGFEMCQALPASLARTLKEKDFVSWNKNKNTWQKTKEEKEIYYYQAQLERIVDGDTLLVHIHFNQDLKKRQYLRLRGINTPPAHTVAGKKATNQIKKLITSGGQITITFKTSTRDPYDRYLSDVWINNTYLNQYLLDKNLAEKVS